MTEKIDAIQQHFGVENAFLDNVQSMTQDADWDAIEQDLKRMRWFVVPAALLFLFVMMVYISVLFHAL